MNDLSLDYINIKSPYLVKRADDGDFVFQTKKGVIYGVGWSKYLCRNHRGE